MLNTRKEHDVLIVYPNIDRLDASVAMLFKEKMGTLLDEGSRAIILNLSGVKFIDSIGLGSIVSILKMIGRKGDLILCNIDDNVMSLFKLTRMDRVFKIFPSEEVALSSLPT